MESGSYWGEWELVGGGVEADERQATMGDYGALLRLCTTPTNRVFQVELKTKLLQLRSISGVDSGSRRRRKEGLGVGMKFGMELE